MSAAAKSLNLFHRRKSRQQIPTSADAPLDTPTDFSTSNLSQATAVPTSISHEARRNILKSFLEKRKRRKSGAKENSKQQAFALEGENDNGDVSQIEGNGIADYRTDGSCMQCGDSVPAFMLEERILEVDGLTVGICLECYPEFLQFLEDSAGDEETVTAIDRANWSWGVPRRSSTRRSSAPDRFATLGMTLTVANPSEDDHSDDDDVPAQRTPNHQRTRSEIHSRATTHTRSVAGAGAAQECTICNDTHPNHDFVPATTSCSHSITYCRTCLSTWITSSLTSYGWNAIRCPADNCKQPLSATDIHLHADKPTLEAYTAAATKSTLSALPNFQWCLSPSCSSGQFHDSQEEDGPIFTCHACGFRSCVVHAVPWHDGETCEQYAYRTDKSLKRREEVASMATVAQTTRRCPKRTGGCGAPIEKNEGCDHMKCRKCGFEFCWICGAAHEPILEFGNSKHEVWCKHWRRG